MVKSLATNQEKKIDRPYVQPIYLVHLLLDGLTLYFSDRTFSYNNHNYEDYLFDLSEIGNEIRSLGGFDNCSVRLKFKNDRILSYNYLIEMFDDYPPEKRYIEIYKLFVDTGESFGSDVSTKIFKGEMGQPYEIDELTFQIDCSSMLFGANSKLPLDVIDVADYPSADPNDVGKYKNIIYGDAKKVICPWTVAGWASTLVEDILSGNTTIQVSDANNAPSPFNAIIGKEWVRVTSKDNNNFTVTRGYNNSNASSHNKGQVIYQQMNTFEVLVAQHPVKAIGDVWGKRSNTSEWVRIISGYNAYNNNNGVAKIIFTQKVVWDQATNIDLSQNKETGYHGHGLNTYVTKICIPTGGDSNLIDNDLGTGTGGTAWNVTFAENNLGTVNKQFIYVALGSGSFTVNNTAVTSMGWIPAQYQRVTKIGGNWNDQITITSNNNATVYEAYKEIEYIIGAVNNNAAAGVDFGAELVGDSVANILIADQIAADVQGYHDVTGNYTGNNNALIERPDHVRKHILCHLLGFNLTDDIDSTSFNSAGNTYASRISGGYKFAFTVPDVTTESVELFRILDLSSRSSMLETQGKFHLFFNSIFGVDAQMTFNNSNVRGRFKFSKGEVADIKNKIRAFFGKDYTKSGSFGEKYLSNVEVSDSNSIAKYGTLTEDMEFPVVSSNNMMSDVLEWILSEKKDLKKIIDLDAFWDAMILEHGDYFRAETPFWNNRKYRLIGMKEDQYNQIIRIKGSSVSPTEALEINMNPYDMVIRDGQMYIAGMSYHDSKYWLAVAKYEVADNYYTLMDYAEHDSGTTGEATGYYGIYVDENHNVYVCGRNGPTGDYAAIVRKLNGLDLSSITWTASKEPTSDGDHFFNDIVKDGSYIYVAGYRYESSYYGLLYKLADSDGAQSWGITDIAGRCFGIAPIYDSHLWVFGSDDSAIRTIWKREDSDGSLDTAYTFDSSSKEDFRKLCSDDTYWYVSGKYVDRSNYKFGCSARIKKSDLVKDYQINRDSVAGVTQEWSAKAVSDGTSLFIIGDYFDITNELYHAVFEKRPLTGSSADWTVAHSVCYTAHSAIAVYGDYIYVGVYLGTAATSEGYIERRKKTDGSISMNY